MSRVIAVQEEQLKMLKETYIKNKPSVAPSLNNGSVLSDSLNIPSVPTSQIDMESQSVNLNAFPNQTSIDPVINSQVTNEVFGAPIASVPTIEQSSNSVVSEVNPVVMDNSGIVNVENAGLPYQEPVLNNNTVPVNVMSDDFLMNLCNSVRNEFDASLESTRNAFHKGMDKVQEILLQKTGANLLNTDVAEETKNEDIVTNPLESPINLGTDTPVANIFDVDKDADKTVFTNDLRQEIADARNEMENGMSKAA